MKTLEDHFHDWESCVFGYGYGTGEHHTLPALHKFFSEFHEGSYDYARLTEALGPVVTWLLINALCKADILEYGTSARYGWLTNDHGRELAHFILRHTPEELYEICCSKTEEYSPCYPDHCNCEDGPCKNPFWGRWTK